MVLLSDGASDGGGSRIYAFAGADRPDYILKIACARGDIPGQRIFYPTNVLRIHTDANIGSPSGRFSITFTGQRFRKEAIAGTPIAEKDTAPGKRWDELFSPMDYVEIRMDRPKRGILVGGQVNPNGAPPAVMRGFIDSVRTRVSGGPHPIYYITVEGRDYGMLWLTAQIPHLDPLVDQTNTILPNLYGIGIGSTDLPTFFSDVMTKIIGRFRNHQDTIIPGGVPPIALDVGVDNPAFTKITNLDLSVFGGVIYSALEAYRATPLVEMFVREDFDAPKFVLRWPKLRDSNGDLITPDGGSQAPPVLHEIDKVKDWIEFDLGLSQLEVKNWFFAIQMQSGRLGQPALATVTPGENPYVIGKSIDKYDLRQMIARYPWLDTGQGALKTPFDAKWANIKLQSGKIALWLAHMYGHNYALYSGSIRVRGQSFYRIGEEIIMDGLNRFYCEGVSQDFVDGPNPSWTTTLSLTRGMPLAGIGAFTDISPFGPPANDFPRGDVGDFFSRIFGDTSMTPSSSKGPNLPAGVLQG